MNDEPRGSRSNYVVVKLNDPVGPGAAARLCSALATSDQVHYAYPAEFDKQGRCQQTAEAMPPVQNAR